MRCPACGSPDTQVTDTRLFDDGLEIRRRRRCLACERRFKTLEKIELSLPSVVKKDGSRCDFDSAKLRASMVLALRKRPVAFDIVEQAVRSIEEQLAASGEREVTSQFLGELVMKGLRRLDKVAYVRFASVYRSFEDVSEFQALLAEVGPRSRRALAEATSASMVRAQRTAGNVKGTAAPKAKAKAKKASQPDTSKRIRRVQ
jgi:transcriptional repressor NrdR